MSFESDPRSTVATASVSDLADALTSHRDPFGRVRIDGVEYFRCPRCASGDYSGTGSASINSDSVNWSCSRCHCAGTRFELERLVLESADALGRLLDAVAA